MSRLLSTPCRPRLHTPPTPTLTLTRARSGAPARKNLAQKRAEWENIRQQAYQGTSVQLGGNGGSYAPTKPPWALPSNGWKPNGAPIVAPKTKAPSLKLSRDTLLPYLSEKVSGWMQKPELRQRLQSYGMPTSDIKLGLETFANALRTQPIFDQLNFTPERIDRMIHDLASGQPENIDSTLTGFFYEWASHPSSTPELSQVVSPGTLASIVALFRAADMLSPSSNYDMTRTEARRKVIMHVGPTNSGKTHNALRALASAEYGMYAGPLRLLAHEIFDRLNNGQIIPLGHEADPTVESDEDTNIDVAPVGDKPAIQKQGDKRYVRACNLLTGEEQRVVDEGAGMISCTVEMTPGSSQFDVAVVDEIQMISDPERGGAWSFAVLAINAKELHLCGEETAVPIVESLLRDTGDELTVHRYQRLSPLQCASESLHGDYSRVEKGDCYVTFSRSGIFRAKESIEKKTGLKCAVAYGRLPPELRAEQAALFNDPNSELDVMVGSDAIGMGLNLKIKRIIFDSTMKFSGREMKSLSLSAIKQIAGRAGRYGLHGDNSTGGVVTTLHRQDLEVVRGALASTPPALKFARISLSFNQIEAVAQALPPNSSLATIQRVFGYVSRMHPSFQLQDNTNTILAAEQLEKVGANLTLHDHFLFYQSPIPWRDPMAVRIVMTLVRMYAAEMRVSYRKLFKTTGIQTDLDSAKTLMETGAHPPPDTLQRLETMHKTIILYLWLSYRKPVSFHEREQVTQIKVEVEKLMDWCLEFGAGANATKSNRSFRPYVTQRSGSKRGVRTVLEVPQRTTRAGSTMTL